MPRYCDSYDQGDCAWFARGVGYVDGKPIKVEKLDLRKVDKARFEQSNRDPPHPRGGAGGYGAGPGL
jgi:hypothetical protein